MRQRRAGQVPRSRKAIDRQGSFLYRLLNKGEVGHKYLRLACEFLRVVERDEAPHPIVLVLSNKAMTGERDVDNRVVAPLRNAQTLTCCP